MSDTPMTDDREQRAGDMQAHQYVVQASFCAHLERLLNSANRRIAELECATKELRKDKARLNWLEQQRASLVCGTRDDHNGEPNRILWIVDTLATDASHEMVTAREAIDVAIEAERGAHE